ncbi:hypothetical protein [Hyalangium rubrum]|uniref:Calpain catalytic domain-containing protein n=1 Tax=Hyalangium rubrum TaxID=3103134 RepID=A0ABU5H241_9BACT|nr:hypothetical protein [Hyalangium sp. s54d21]MDY7227513.1 hypothetical protein [Hyalangium sp. s54d21]
MIRRVDGGSSSVGSVEKFSRPEAPAPEPKVVRPAIDQSKDTFSTGGKAIGAAAKAAGGAVAEAGGATGATGAAGVGDAKANKTRDEFQATEGYKSLSTEQQKQALEVFDTMDAAGQRNMVDLAERQVNGKTALLDTDTTGKTLLSNLHQIATQPMPQSFADAGVTRESLLGSITQEASNPGQINQHDRGTCTVTSMQYMLNSSNPAEYMRLMAGLTSESGEVKLANGDTLSRDKDSIAMDSATDRSSSERLFQSAMMQYAKGGDEDDYSNVADKDEGLDAGEQEDALEGLFSKGFDNESGSMWNFTPGEEEVLNLLKERSPQDTYIRMKWGEGKEGGHAVVVDRVENGRVYFRNPHGPGGTQGDKLEDPPRIVEDPNTGIQSMSEEDFLKWVKSAMVPS